MIYKIIVAIGGGLYAIYVIVALLRALDGRDPFRWDDWIHD